MRTRVVERTSLVPAPIDAVWGRVTSFEGINHELMPVMSMTVPKGAEGLDVTTVPVGQPLGRAWVKLFGVVPVDYDDLTIAELVPGRSFHEVSTMLSARRWEHERTLTEVDGGTRVHDRLTFVPRAPAGRVHAWLIGALFSHRHRRLLRHFATATS